MHRFLLPLLLLATAAASPPAASTGEHQLRASDGVKLWYRIAGVEHGLPVVFLHGGPGEGSQAMQALGGPELEKRVRMVYLDQRGSGRSDRPKDPKLYSLARVGADVEELRQALGADKIVLLGHSAGTIMALDYAADHPEHVAGLILAGAVPDLPAATDALCDRARRAYPGLYPKMVKAADAGQKCNPFLFDDSGQRQAFFDANMFPNLQVRDRVNWIDAIPGVANGGTLGGALFDQGLTKYRFARPARITMPLLFLSGAKDFQTALAPQRALAGKVRDGRVVVIPKAGHFMFADEPARFAAEVSAFVAKVSR